MKGEVSGRGRGREEGCNGGDFCDPNRDPELSGLDTEFEASPASFERPFPTTGRSQRSAERQRYNILVSERPPPSIEAPSLTSGDQEWTYQVNMNYVMLRNVRDLWIFATAPRCLMRSSYQPPSTAKGRMVGFQRHTVDLYLRVTSILNQVNGRWIKAGSNYAIRISQTFEISPQSTHLRDAPSLELFVHFRSQKNVFSMLYPPVECLGRRSPDPNCLVGTTQILSAIRPVRI